MAIAELPRRTVVRVAKALVTSSLLVMEITPAKMALVVVTLDTAALVLTVSDKAESRLPTQVILMPSLTDCRSEVCVGNCDAKSECDPGFGPEWAQSSNCPLNACCSEFG